MSFLPESSPAPKVRKGNRSLFNSMNLKEMRPHREDHFGISPQLPKIKIGAIQNMKDFQTSRHD